MGCFITYALIVAEERWLFWFSEHDFAVTRRKPVNGQRRAFATNQDFSTMTLIMSSAGLTCRISMLFQKANPMSLK